MQSYLYRNDERIKSVFSQFMKELPTKKSSEKSKGAEGSISGGFLEFFKASTKGSLGKKTITESIETPENMISALINIDPVKKFISQISVNSDWNTVNQGDLIIFRGDLEFDSYGLTKEQLWDATYDDIGNREIRHDLRLKGKIADKKVEMPFSSNHVTGTSQFTVLCHATFDKMEGIAIIIGSTRSESIMLQPLAFGNGFFN